jgi:metallo-beta-lactamase family protein
MIMESVYGDRNHEPKDERDAKFEKIVTETIAKGGTLVIPSFSLERTQVILYELNNIAEKGKLNVPVYVDSPLATKVTDIYRESTELFNEGIKKQIASGDDIFDFKKLKFTINHEESNALDRMQGPKIILAGSGMSMGGRVRHHEASYLPNPNNTILLVGYQPLGTLGRNLQDAKNSVTIDKQKIKVEAKIETIFGYSSHKDSDHLVEFVSHGKATLKKVFPVMGEPKSSLFLAQRIKDELGIDAMYPEKGKRYEL